MAKEKQESAHAHFTARGSYTSKARGKAEDAIPIVTTSRLLILLFE